MTDRPVARIGVTLMSPPDNLSRAARAFEHAGVDSLWLGEYFHAALVRAAVVGTATSRPTVGTHVLQAFARSPLATALAAGDLQELTRGRFVLGVGSQVRAANRRWHGVDTPEPVAMLEEYVNAVRVLLGTPFGEASRFDGHHVHFDVPPLLPDRRYPSPPVYVGGAGRRTVAAAASVADGLLGHLLWTPEHVDRDVRAALSDRAARSFPVTIARLAAPSTVSGWEVDAARTLGHYATTREYQALARSDRRTRRP
jgi:alkanesulfonate monooxygenase SsuD/methylene tetrahydromethanopterin reductase-like flavin-dependent oxidoreductase (luciferase family)